VSLFDAIFALLYPAGSVAERSPREAVVAGIVAFGLPMLDLGILMLSIPPDPRLALFTLPPVFGALGLVIAALGGLGLWRAVVLGFSCACLCFVFGFFLVAIALMTWSY
jgi:hypothetical protein